MGKNKIYEKDPFYDLTNDEFGKYVENAISAHGAWLTKLKDMVDSQMVLPLQQDSSKCGFGHFYYSMTPKTPEIRAIWKQVEGKHKKFHEFGKAAKAAIMNEDYTLANQKYHEAENYSKDLIAEFKEMKEIAAKMAKNQ